MEHSTRILSYFCLKFFQIFGLSQHLIFILLFVTYVPLCKCNVVVLFVFHRCFIVSVVRMSVIFSIVVWNIFLNTWMYYIDLSWLMHLFICHCFAAFAPLEQISLYMAVLDFTLAIRPVSISGNAQTSVRFSYWNVLCIPSSSKELLHVDSGFIESLNDNREYPFARVTFIGICATHIKTRHKSLRYTSIYKSI